MCKTGTKESSPDMFNFHVVLADHDMVTAASRATMCRREFKGPSLQAKKKQEKKDLPKNGLQRKNSLKISDRKKIHF